MVGWYNPNHLLRTAGEVLVSQLFAHHSDARRLQGLSPQSEGNVLDFRVEHDTSAPFWFDFVADIGEGWNPTYAVASTLAKPVLTVDDGPPLERGRLLIFGGDLVYPTPSRRAYHERLLRPYADAYARATPPAPELIAIPGNHDWYDSLVEFRRLFLRRMTFGPFQTTQTRSYFVARLPHGWSLFGVDLQLAHDLDEAQFAFFTQAIEAMDDHERVVVLAPESFWIVPPKAPAPDYEGLLLWKLLEVLGPRLRVVMAGDLHHYRRYSDAEGRHLITCGCGGAFTHPTHAAHDVILDGFTHVRSFPEPAVSRRLTWRNLAFPFINPGFGIVPALAYLFTSWENGLHVGTGFGQVYLEEIGMLGLSRWQEALYTALHSTVLSPTGALLYLLIVSGFVFFSDRSSPVFRWVGGVTHALAHVATGFLIYWFAMYATITDLGLTPKSIDQYLAAGAIVVGLGWLAGSFVMGMYLLIALNGFGKHGNEAFSALRIQDWKGFVRACVTADRRLELHFIGLEHVSRRWRAATGEGPSAWEPAAERRSQPTRVDHVTLERTESWPVHS